MSKEAIIDKNAWRGQRQRYSLTGERCPNEDCGAPIVEIRDFCPKCRRSTIMRQEKPREAPEN